MTLDINAPTGVPGAGDITFIPAGEIIKAQEDQARKEAQEAQQEAVVLALAAYIRQCWQVAVDAKRPITERMLRALRARNGEYEPDKLAMITEQGTSAIYMRLTDEKCTAAESWLEDILLPPGEEPWDIGPTPRPSLRPDQEEALEAEKQRRALAFAQAMLAQEAARGGFATMEQAQARLQALVAEITDELEHRLNVERTKLAREEADRLQEFLEDVVVESQWRAALRQVISDLVQYPAGILKGPVLRIEDALDWTAEAGMATVQKIVKRFERVSPFDIFPSPSSTEIDDGWLIERHRLSRQDLIRLKGVAGYQDRAIDLVLEFHGQQPYGQQPATDLHSATDSGDASRQAAEDRPHQDRDPDGRIEALQFWGSVQGRMINEWGGIEGEEIDALAEYEVEAWLVGEFVIKLILNPDKIGRKPYYKASFRDKVGSFWGRGLPELIEDCQDACNAAARNLVNNMGIASGPQVTVDVSRMEPGQDITSVYPWKVWQVDGSSGGGTTSPVQFYQPQVMVEGLLKVYEFFSNEADNKTGVPKYAYGSNEGRTGALATASGLAMMVSNASKSIKKVVRNVDFGIIVPSITRVYCWVMVYDQEARESYRGDAVIVARGSSSLVVKEQQQLRRQEALKVLTSPAVLQIIGRRGLAQVLRDVLTGLDIEAEDVVPSPRELEMQERQAAMLAQAQAQGGQPVLPAPEATHTDLAGNPAGGKDFNLWR